MDALGVSGEGDEAETVGEDLVLDDGRIVLDIDVLDGEGGYLGDEDAAEGVCDGGIDADEGEGGFVLGVVVELDAEVVCELFEVPGVVLAWVGSWIVGRGYIGDGLLVDADYLEDNWLDIITTGESVLLTHPPPVQLGLTGCDGRHGGFVTMAELQKSCDR